jgi:GTP-binding protein Era
MSREEESDSRVSSIQSLFGRYGTVRGYPLREMDVQMSAERKKAGYVAIIGKPNVGKSSLMNALLQHKLAITSPKPQTTRHRIMGILSGDDYQVIFLDTPGIHEPGKLLDEVMVKTAKKALREADLIVLMIDVTDFSREVDLVLEDIKSAGSPVVLAINKIDMIRKELILPVIAECAHLHDFASIIPMSVLLNDGIDTLLEHIIDLLPESEFLYPPDTLTDHPERFFAAELIRGTIFDELRDEIPYSVAVEIEQFTEKGNKTYIKANIFVEKQSQKGILIGKGGVRLKSIGKISREQIEQFLSRSIYLDLWVKVKKKWRSRSRDLSEFGYSRNQ